MINIQFICHFNSVEEGLLKKGPLFFPQAPSHFSPMSLTVLAFKQLHGLLDWGIFLQENLNKVSRSQINFPNGSVQFANTVDFET